MGLYKEKTMSHLVRNTAYGELFDDNSFMGLLLESGTWSDKEYWLLENELIEILRKGVNNDNINAILTIVSDITYFPNIGHTNLSLKDKNCRKRNNISEATEPTIYDRYHRLRTLLRAILGDDIDFLNIDFEYQPNK